MPSWTFESLREKLAELDDGHVDYATKFVELLLQAAASVSASDVHCQPGPETLEIHLRLDGVLQHLGNFSPGTSTKIVTRLKVLAGLLTYRQDVPQEGRLAWPVKEAHTGTEVRVSTFPTIFGERVAIRLFPTTGRFLHLDSLGLPEDLLTPLRQLLMETTGCLLVSGPAGSGKTTTGYACLREILRTSPQPRCVMGLEDPIEVVVSGIAQSRVDYSAGLDFTAGLKAMLRQDPEVIFLGEIRDRETAEVAFQAALTGQLVLTTFHAGNAIDAVGRLAEMGIPAYAIRNGVHAILAQRLVRALCRCSEISQKTGAALGLDIDGPVRESRGCPDCHGTGYRGRMLLAEMLPLGQEEVRSCLATFTGDVSELRTLMRRWEWPTLLRRGSQAVAAGKTSPAEIRRVLGFKA